MNKLLLLAMFLPALSMAEKPTFEECKTYSEYAGAVMDGRQNGTSMIDIYEAARDDKVLSEIVRQAYSRTKFRVQKNRDNSVIEFKNEFFLFCIGST